MGKRSNFERISKDFYPTPVAAVPPLIRICVASAPSPSRAAVMVRW